MDPTSRTTDHPSLSVVVVILAGPKYLVRCLEALEKQQGTDAFEIVVPHDDSLEAVPALEHRFPNVRFVRQEGSRTLAELRAAGFQAARGDVVALTEDHCSPDKRWCATVLELHQGPWAAVGGSVDKRGPDTTLNWAVYLADFGRYMNPVAEGPSPYLSDHNITYKRAALDATAELWRREFHDTTVNWALQEKGEPLVLSRRLIVRQQRKLAWGDALAERYRCGRLFAGTRVVGAGLGKRAVWATSSVALPAVLVLRMLRNVASKRRWDVPFLRALPALAVLDVVWAWGEVVGYVTGRAAPAPPPAVALGAPAVPAGLGSVEGA